MSVTVRALFGFFGAWAVIQAVALGLKIVGFVGWSWAVTLAPSIVVGAFVLLVLGLSAITAAAIDKS